MIINCESETELLHTRGNNRRNLNTQLIQNFFKKEKKEKK